MEKEFDDIEDVQVNELVEKKKDKYSKVRNDTLIKMDRQNKGFMTFLETITDKTDEFFYYKRHPKIRECSPISMALAFYRFATTFETIEEIDAKFPHSFFKASVSCNGFGIRSIENAIKKTLDLRLHNSLISAMTTPDSTLDDIKRLPDAFFDKDSKLSSVAISYCQNMRKSSQEKIEISKKMAEMVKPDFGSQGGTHVTIDDILNLDIDELTNML